MLLASPGTLMWLCLHVRIIWKLAEKLSEGFRVLCEAASATLNIAVFTQTTKMSVGVPREPSKNISS